MVGAIRSTTVTRRRLTADEYQRMIRVGILREGDRIELIDGEMYQMAAMGGPHIACVARINRKFDRRIGNRAIVLVQSAFRLSAYSEPEPDIVLARYRDDFYASALPGPDDILLIVEVSDSTMRHDRTTKLPLYAAAGIPEVWIVDLRRRRILVYRSPSPDGYRQSITYTPGASLASLAFPDIVIGWQEIFGNS